MIHNVVILFLHDFFFILVATEFILGTVIHGYLVRKDQFPGNQNFRDRTAIILVKFIRTSGVNPKALHASKVYTTFLSAQVKPNCMAVGDGQVDQV